METLFSGQKESVMDEEVRELLRREQWNRPSGAAFYSHIFFVPKKEGRLRPIINLKPLNQFLFASHFSMPTVKDLFQLLQRGDRAVCLNLKDAYFHIPRVFKVLMERNRLSVQMPSFRPVDQPLDFYQNNQNHCSVPQNDGRQNSFLFGRHTSAVGGDGQRTMHCVSFEQCGFHRQPGEVRPDPFPMCTQLYVIMPVAIASSL